MKNGPVKITFPEGAFSTTSAAVLVTTVGGDVVWANPSFEQLAGCRFSELSGLDPWPGFGREGTDAVRTAILAARGVPPPPPVDTTAAGPDGTTRTTRWTPLLARDGTKPRQPYIVVLGVDVGCDDQPGLLPGGSDLRYQPLFEHTGVAILFVREDTTIALVNRGAERLSGYSKDELEGGMTWAQLIPDADDLDRMRGYHRLRRIDPALAPDQYDATVRTRDGARRRTTIRVALVPGTTSSLISLVDISDRIAAEEAIHHQEEKYRSLVDNMQDTVYRCDLEGRLTFVSPAGARVLGIASTEELIGRDIASEFYGNPDDRLALLDELKRHGKVTNYEIALKRRDGSLVPVSTNSQFFYDKHGHLSGVEGIFSDISQRKAAEEMSRQSEDKFSKIFMMAPDCIAITRLSDGLILDVNRGFEEITGWPRDEAVGHTSHDIRFWVDRSARDHMCAELRTGRDVMGCDFRFRRKDGSERTGIYSARVILIDDERCLVFILQDVTDRIRLQDERRRLEQQLSQSRKMDAIGQLAGGVAHDFNNMLGVILGETELALLSLDPAEPVHGHLLEIQTAARRSTDLTKRLLAFARRQTIAPRVLNLNETVAGMLTMLRRLIGEDIDLRWAPGIDVWPVLMDPGQIDQILANLCVNARDAIAGIGKVTIETRNASLDEAFCSIRTNCVPGDYILLSVSDSGHGMDPETLESLFEPFFTTKAVGRGTGLGLATVYGIVRQNSGAVTVDSTVNVGSAFRIYLPRFAGAVEPTQVEPVAEPTGQGRETILLVEDEPGVLKLSRMMLERLGYRVLSAGMPGKAIQLAETHAGTIHLLMTDVIMPEMNGRDLASRLQTRYPGLRTLFASGYTSDVIAHRGVLEGGVHFIQKPFSMAELSAKVREALDPGPGHSPAG
jgi:PAS domain S-box-containing protein